MNCKKEAKEEVSQKEMRVRKRQVDRREAMQGGRKKRERWSTYAPTNRDQNRGWRGTESLEGRRGWFALP